MEICLKRLSTSGSGNVVRLDFEITDGTHLQRECFDILSEQYIALRPEKGIVDSSTYDGLLCASQVCQCYLKALNILSFGDNNMFSLKVKLMRRGFSSEVAEKTVAMVSEKGYVREENVAAAEVKKCVSKLWGRTRILAQLRAKGFDSDSIDKAMLLVENTNFAENCYLLADKKFGCVPDEPRERQKMAASLARYGYGPEEIKFAMKKLS